MSDKNEASARIMIVDDIPTNTTLLTRILGMSGFDDVVVTNDSRQAVPLYLERQPDVLLLDLKMPYLDGFQVMEALNEVKGNDYLPVIIITAQDDQINRLRAYELGAKDFIAKPFDNTEVVMRIRNMLEIRLLHKAERANIMKLEVDVDQRTIEVKGLRLELVNRLVRAAEFRDNNTGFHVQRISAYAYSLGKALGIEENDAEMLKQASALHDIGKIGITDEILLKPAKLNPEEWEIMKQHTVKGAQILGGSDFPMLQMAEKIALTHHERWNGTGYPNRLKGDEIPLVGRITAVCDVFDALVSRRPYKVAWPMEKALVEMQKGSNDHFDPTIVTAFFDILPEIMTIKESMQEL